jgi:hypothetical protein
MEATPSFKCSRKVFGRCNHSFMIELICGLMGDAFTFSCFHVCHFVSWTVFMNMQAKGGRKKGYKGIGKCPD